MAQSLITIKQQTAYGAGKRKFWSAHLHGKEFMPFATGDSKEAVALKALKAISDAMEYSTCAAVVRVATDGTIMVFRYLSADTAMYEFCRNGQRGSGSCMGKMTDGNNTYRNLGEYADYVVKQYNGVS